MIPCTRCLLGEMAVFDDLLQTIEKLKARIREHGTYIAPYESRTRVALIDPLLTALGWDVSDPSLVHIEPRTVNGWADYALLGSNGEPIAFVEAKKLNSSQDAMGQTVSYVVQENVTNHTNVRFGATTDGNQWNLYDVVAQRLVMSASINGDNSAKAALQFIALWRQSFSTGVFTPAVEPVVADAIEGAPQTATSPIVDATPPLPPEPSVPLGDWTPLTGRFESTGKPAPSAIQFPNGQTAAIKSWRGVLIETVLWLIRRGEFGPQDCPVAMGPTRYLLSLDGMHRSGKVFHAPVAIGSTGIMMEGSLNPSDSVHFAQVLLKGSGHDPSQMLLRI